MKKQIFLLITAIIALSTVIFTAGCNNSGKTTSSATQNTTETATSSATKATSTTNKTTISSDTNPASSATTVSPTEISKEKAEDIAVRHAGFTLDNVTVKHTKADTEDGKPIYEVDFIAENVEYEYDIDRQTGDVLYAKKDIENGEDEIIVDKTRKLTTEVSTTTITAGEAKNIALKHANVTEEQANFTKVELETDSGDKIYEIEFIVGTVEYDYDINAVTGAIISSEKS